MIRALGIGAAGLVALLVAGTLSAVAWRAEPGRGLSPADWAAVRFTVWQAAASAVLSVGLAIPVARALSRRRFPGRALLVTLLGAPFLLPVIVAVLGLLAVFGRSGWVNEGLAAAGVPTVTIYGAHGVILAHVFFNLPLAVRLILQGWQDIPAERFRLAANLGLGRRRLFRHLEWPMLREVCPGALLVVFLVCCTSFAVALTLGGGPRATTIELAIYQAFRFDFDLGRAALLSLIQLAITATAGLMAFATLIPDATGGGLGRQVNRWDGAPWDWAWIALGTAFLVTPLLALVLRGLPELANLDPAVWAAAGRSLATAMGSAAICLALALPIALAAARLRPAAAGAVELAGLAGLAASPLVLGTGLFILIYPVAAPSVLALPVTGLVNAVAALPFALRALIPAARRVERDYGRLAASLGLTGRLRVMRLDLPRLRRPLGFSAGLAAALSMGDLGVIALFADAQSATLPLQLYRLMGAYRMDEAAGAALLLLATSLALFWIFDRGGRVNADL